MKTRVPGFLLLVLTACIISSARLGEEGPMKLTDANFKEKVLQADKLTIVDFWATWCGPCQRVGPVIEELAKEYNGKINVGKVDVDQNPQLAYQYHISSIPLVLFIKNGKVVDKLVGAYPKSAYIKKIKQHI